MGPIVERRWLLRSAALLAMAGLSSCGSAPGAADSGDAGSSRAYIVSVLDEPETTDFQCTTIDYTIALNVFNRLVETKPTEADELELAPSLAESWEVSDDGLSYTFRLREGVTFSDGTPLTASDVRYTLMRLLTHPKACNQDIARDILGAAELEAGQASDLAGFKVVDDLTFEIRLKQPFSAFLTCLSMPGASILSEKLTEAAGERFGLDPALTVGTGPFLFKEWRAGEGLILEANKGYWEGEPRCSGVDLRFVYDPERLSSLFHDGEIDILNADDLGDLSEFYLHGEAYKSQVHRSEHVGIDYIALNESVRPLDDARVRKALQLSLNRQTLLDAAYGGEGLVEHGIYPHGLYGYNPNLAPIPHDPDAAKALLAEAGYGDGFDLNISMRASSTLWQRQLIDMVKSMWEKVGVRPTVTLLDDEEFMSQRTSGKLACYTASWAADYNDPDNFIYTFFGTEQNSQFRSICYANRDAMARVRAARSILDEQARIEEYRDLERLIVQEDAAWIPLFTRFRHFLVSKRLEHGFATMWNGWFEGCYKDMFIEGS